jgi:calcium-dependent protein kinase
MKLVEKKKISTDEEQKKFLTEIQILKSLDHPNILKIFEFYQDKKNYYIIIELCSGGELFDKIIEQGNFTEKEASYIMKQLLGAVYYAHSRNIVHR